MTAEENFRFSIDRGGTFTDIYAEVPGEPGFRVVKLLSSDPGRYDDAPREGIRRIMSEVMGKDLPPDGIDPSRIDWVRMGTTVATNALLERQGARTALLITKGFRDLLEIGSQNRPKIFDLKIRRPELLYQAVIEIDERVRIVRPDSVTPHNPTVQTISGETVEIIRQPDQAVIRNLLKDLQDQGIESLAVVFMHGAIFPDHEQLVGALAKQFSFRQISLSSAVMPMVKIVPRGDTTLIDAYLTPHIRDYITGFKNGFHPPLADTRLLFMRSDGGLAPAASFSGSKAILSGPAGGVIGYARTVYLSEMRPVIGFDMGGTSTDVSRYDGTLELVHETETTGIRVQAPQLDIQTVAAGGGSRLFFRHGMFEVGPESAGADPGPACYRKNGPLTITDANLVLGRLHPEFFPKIFGPTGNQSLDPEASQAAFETIRREINAHRTSQNQGELSIEEIALGFLKVANEVMVRPMREISVARGFDLKDHVLACFGGAGGQHACAIAGILGIKSIRIHRFAGILSAYGLGLADVVEELTEPAATPLLPETMPELLKRLDHLAKQAAERLKAQGFDEATIQIDSFLNLRYQGTDTPLMVNQPDNNNFQPAFEKIHQREFGFLFPNRPLLVDNLRIRAVGLTPGITPPPVQQQESALQPETHGPCFFDTGRQETPIYTFSSLGAGATLTGPALIIHNTSTIVIEPNCRAHIDENGDLLINLGETISLNHGNDIDPIRLSVFSNLFMSVAEQMGRALQKTAISTNIKERLDFSCALFDGSGGLVANAPHQPVHLGAMSEAVRHQIEIHGDDLAEGDVLLTNHPVYGGSHLPDLTVITPVFHQGQPVFFVANRGHHADIGGISPGSMPPSSRTLSEEGVCIKSYKLLRSNVLQEEGLQRLLLRKDDPDHLARSFPARNIADNLADLKAQVAANRKGVNLLKAMIDRHSLPTVLAYMGHIQDNAELAVRVMLKKLCRGGHPTILAVEDFLDDGSPIRINVTIHPDTGNVCFDFRGSGQEVPGNCNAPRAVTASAIIYVLRCLIHENIPLNQGCLNPVTMLLPAGSLLAPSDGAAVVGGNVLTSQRIVDVLLKAFGAAAASQGCMNNFTFGNDSFGYYETIGGGAGAGPGWHGTSGVHTHMTNTRITDPEILEKRYPVLLRRFCLRQNSGGHGQWMEGNGLIREVEFLAPMEAAILSERRIYAPYGLKGGSPGAKGNNRLYRNNGETINLGGKNSVRVEPGDRIEIMTPGGGGYGKAG
ncbi:MAG: hydantoinase B/oxoprolinase family protein [Proteobacteria bacterium]|nr:hydantoinase B/oxoprolinase family protein [Pseudomonadota bacterium]MBU1688370.1 hydantoinase B/oxoprolinase family protein [Pseudomonadota bacterium]